MRRHRYRIARLAGSVALTVLIAGLAGGCKTTRTATDTTGSLAQASVLPPNEAEARNAVAAWGERYRAAPDDLNVVVSYAQALRQTGQRQQAVAVIEQALIRRPKDMTLLGAYGRALADAGRHQQALNVLNEAHTPDRPDWRILSVQGAVLDQMGRHTEAQSYYATALKIVPGEPSILSNLGLSYALAKDLKRAEQTLREATERPGAGPRVRQNLALVVGLQGRFQEAETIAQADLPANEAAANVAYLRQMLAERKEAKPSRARLAMPGDN